VHLPLEARLENNAVPKSFLLQDEAARVHRPAPGVLTQSLAPTLQGLSQFDPGIAKSSLGRSDNLTPPSESASPAQPLRMLEDYITGHMNFASLNDSFIKARRSVAGPEPLASSRSRADRQRSDSSTADQPVAEFDAKLLLLGNVEENGAWWTGPGQRAPRTPPTLASTDAPKHPSLVSLASPRIDWFELDDWYDLVINGTNSWRSVHHGMQTQGICATISKECGLQIDEQLRQAQEHARKTLLAATERLLRRPGGRISEPGDLRFLLIILANPLLHPSFAAATMSATVRIGTNAVGELQQGSSDKANTHRYNSLVKRILGLLANSPEDCRRYLISWLAHYSHAQLNRTKELVYNFLVYRLRRQIEKRRAGVPAPSDGLIPSLEASQTPAVLHATLGRPPTLRRGTAPARQKVPNVYVEDWQVEAAVAVLAWIAAANDRSHQAGRGFSASPSSGRAMPLSDFYVPLLDQFDLVSDFERWESKSANGFAFVQYPFLLSIGAKTRILEHDARRQMDSRARDAFFDSIMRRRTVEQFLTLNVRRDCLVEDSLKAVSEVIGSGSEDVKKALRIVFRGEEGLDAGGLRKEWFLLLVREVFHPDHGKFSMYFSLFLDRSEVRCAVPPILGACPDYCD
jgi:E3 ubiquitin-protein ligase HECTD2